MAGILGDHRSNRNLAVGLQGVALIETGAGPVRPHLLSPLQNSGVHAKTDGYQAPSSPSILRMAREYA